MVILNAKDALKTLEVLVILSRSGLDGICSKTRINYQLRVNKFEHSQSF